MKYYFCFPLLTALLLACLPLRADGGNGITYLPSVDVAGCEVSRSRQEVELAMTFDLERLQLKAQHTVALTPVLLAADGSREAVFPPLVIDGKTRHRVYLRARRLPGMELPPCHGGEAQAVVRRRNGTGQRYDYRAALPYERWMLDGRVELREQVHGCANCAVGAAALRLAEGVLPPFVPAYRMEAVPPAPEEVKRRAEVRTARLQFRQASHEILPGFGNNRAELDSVAHSIALVKDDPDLTITGIYITGYASPEGGEAYNLRLSQRRADALARYAQRDTHTDATLWHVEGKGEDWEGLRHGVLQHSNLPKADEVLEVIDNCRDNRDACERRLKAIRPADTYRRLLEEVYPPLRRNEYRIAYNVRNFDLEEAKHQIRTRPSLLSLAEMYTVANAYGKETEEHREALLIAARTYPDRMEAVVNAACMELERDNAEAAIRLLEASPCIGEAEVQNVLGVAYARTGQYTRARSALEQAAAAGSRDAAVNLEQLAGVMDDWGEETE